VTWLNAWALIGLAGIALPVLIHLLARGHARTHRFPSLRFIDASQLLPTRRTRVQDPLLLALRCAIVGLAALALAQPVLLTARRKQAAERGVARAIVVDTSAGMRRITPSGSTAVDSARRAARALANEAEASILIETNSPAQALPPAAAWLSRHYQRSELVVISDFPRGQLDSNDVRALPADVTVALRRVPVVSNPVVESQWEAGDRRITVRTSLRGEYTDAEWAVTNDTSRKRAVTLIGADSDRAAMNATRIAAATTATQLPVDSSRAVAIVFPEYGGRRTLDTATHSAYAPWMVALLARLDAHGNDVQRSAVALLGNQRQLVLFTDSAPGSLASARLVAAADSVLSSARVLSELESETLSESEVASLERPARNTLRSRPGDPNGTSDARWLWAVVLLLLLIELPLRRRATRPAAPAIEDRARAA